MDAYADDVKVGEFTQKLINAGHRAFHVFLLAGTLDEHIKKLLEFFNPAQGIKIIDLGCGIGEVAKQMKLIRPDLNFILVNKSASQLSMCPDEFEKIESDFHAVPIEAGSCSAVMINYALGHADLYKLMPEIARLLKNGGYLYIYDLMSRHEIFIDELNYRVDSMRTVIDAAKKVGFSNPQITENPRHYHQHMISFLGEAAFDHLFLGVYPYLAKFSIDAH